MFRRLLCLPMVAIFVSGASANGSKMDGRDHPSGEHERGKHPAADFKAESVDAAVPPIDLRLDADIAVPDAGAIAEILPVPNERKTAPEALAGVERAVEGIESGAPGSDERSLKTLYSETGEPEGAPVPAASPKVMPSGLASPVPPHSNAGRGKLALVPLVPFAAAVAASPWLYVHAHLAAIVGSVALIFIGSHQILRNFWEGKKAAQDVALSWPLLWFAVSVLLSVSSLGAPSGSLWDPTNLVFWWNVSNLSAVLQSALMAAQVVYFVRRPGELRKTLGTAAAVLALLASLYLLLPWGLWLGAAQAAAMTLMLFIGWPQARYNHLLFQSQGRGPQGLGLGKFLFLLIGGWLSLVAALAVGNALWVFINAESLVITLTVLSQTLFPAKTDAALAPLFSRLLRIEGKVAAFLKKAQGD